jgi:hypothetical protein
MRYPRLLLVVGVMGCGRFGFDAATERTDATNATIDASPDALRMVDCTFDPDGTPCDDRSICSPASACSSGLCNPTTLSPAICTVADSTNDFDITQGVNGWYYGFWDAEGDPSYDPSTDFQPGVWDGTSTWGPTSGTNFLYMASWGAHARFGPLRLPIRRWVSTVQGPAVASIHFDKSDISCGDGVEVRLVVDGSDVWTRSIAFDDNAGITDAVVLELVVGTLVELHVRPLADDGCDTTNTTLTISSP